MHTIILAPSPVNAGLVKAGGLTIRRHVPYNANSVTRQFFANPIVAERMVVVTLDFDLQGVHVHIVEMGGVLYEVALLSIKNEGQFNLSGYELTVTRRQDSNLVAASPVLQ